VFGAALLKASPPGRASGLRDLWTARRARAAAATPAAAARG